MSSNITPFLLQEGEFLEIYPNSSEVRPLPMKQIKGMLANYRKVALIVNEAIKELIARNAVTFDGLVGECACQYRAAMITEMLSLPKEQLDLEKWAAEVQGIISRLNVTLDLNNQKGKVDYAELMRIRALEKNISKITFVDYVNKEKLNPTLPKGILAAVLAYLLCITKVIEPDRYVPEGENGLAVLGLTKSGAEETKPIKAIAGESIGKGLGKPLDNHARVKLSQYSVEYVRSMACTLPNNGNILELLSEAYFKKDARNRWMIPAFAGYETLILGAIPRGFVMRFKALVIDEETGKIMDTFSLIHNPANHSLKGRAVIAIDGVIRSNARMAIEEHKKKLEETDLDEMMIAFGAAHPQYAGKESFEEFAHSKERYHFYKEMAFNNGYCKENSRTFQTYHMYPDRLSDEQQ